MIAKIIFVRTVAPSAFQRNIKWKHLFDLSLIFYHKVLLLGISPGRGECFYAKYAVFRQFANCSLPIEPRGLSSIALSTDS